MTPGVNCGCQDTRTAIGCSAVYVFTQRWCASHSFPTRDEWFAGAGWVCRLGWTTPSLQIYITGTFLTDHNFIVTDMLCLQDAEQKVCPNDHPKQQPQPAPANHSSRVGKLWDAHHRCVKTYTAEQPMAV